MNLVNLDYKLSNYLHKIVRQKEMVRCRECTDWISIPQFEKHVQYDHRVTKNACPWCFGHYTYPSRQKKLHIPHLDACLDAFMTRYSLKRPRSASPPPPIHQSIPSTSRIQPNDVEPYTCDRVHTFPDQFYFKYGPMYPEHDMFSAKSFSEDLISSGVYQMKFTLDGVESLYEWWRKESAQLENRLTFRGNDNMGVYYVKMFLRMKEVLGCFQMWHVYVRFPGYKSFEEQMKEYGDAVLVLPFACLCKGGGTLPRESMYDVYRHHKHMILAIRDVDDFKTNCWKQIKSTLNLPPGVKNYKCKGYKVILNDLHLGFTIRYLGTPRSRCIFENEDLENIVEDQIELVPLSLIMDEEDEPILIPQQQPDPKKHPTQMNHYFIEKSVSQHFMFVLASQVEDMWPRLLNVLRGGTSVEYITEKCIKVPDRYGHNTFWVKIKYALQENPLDMCMVLHVDSKWVPYKISSADERGTAYMYLTDGYKLYFKESKYAEETMLLMDWICMQVVRGNLFNHVIGESLWRPTKPQQTALRSSFNFFTKLDNAEGLLQDKRKECDVLRESIEAKDKKNKEFEKSIQEQDKKIVEFEKSIEERDKKIVEFEKGIEKRDRQMVAKCKQNAELKKGIQNRDKKIKRFENSIHQWDKKIERKLKKSNEEHNKKIVELKKMIEERDKYIVKLENKIKQVERQSTQMNTELIEQLKTENKRILEEKNELQRQLVLIRQPNININVNNK